MFARRYEQIWFIVLIKLTINGLFLTVTNYKEGVKLLKQTYGIKTYFNKRVHEKTSFITLNSKCK